MHNDKSIKITKSNSSESTIPNTEHNVGADRETRSDSRGQLYFRVKSYDFMKGLSMIVIIYLHAIWWLSGPNNYYLFGWCWLFLDLFGPIMYVTLSILSISYSIIYKREVKHQKEKSIFISLLKRFVLLNIIGLFFVINYLNPSKSPFDPLYIFRFHIFQLIAISQLLTYVALKIKQEHRIIIAFIIIFLDRLVYNYILMILANVGISPLNFDSSDLFKSFGDNSILNIGVNIASWAYLLFFRADIDMSFMPWAFLPFLISIPGEYVVRAMINKGKRKEDIGNLKRDKDNKDNGNEDNRNEDNGNEIFIEKDNNIVEANLPKFLLIFGIILFGLGIITGLNYTDHYRNFEIIPLLNAGGPIKVTQLPLFLFRGSWPNLLYGSGFSLIITSFAFRKFDSRELALSKPKLKPKLKPKKGSKIDVLSNKLIYLGQYSLTLYIFHHILVLFQWVSLSTPLAFILTLLYVYLIIYAVLKIIKLRNGRYTLEHLFKKIISSKIIN